MRLDVKLFKNEQLDTYEEVESVSLDEKCLAIKTENGTWFIPVSNIERYFLFDESIKDKENEKTLNKLVKWATETKSEIIKNNPLSVNAAIRKQNEENRIKTYRSQLDKLQVDAKHIDEIKKRAELLDRQTKIERRNRRAALGFKDGDGQFKSDFPKDAINVSGSDHEQKKAELESKLKEAAKYQEIPFNTPEGVTDEVMDNIADNVRTDLEEQQNHEQQLQPQPPFVPKEQMDPSLPDEQVESES